MVSLKPAHSYVVDSLSCKITIVNLSTFHDSAFSAIR